MSKELNRAVFGLIGTGCINSNYNKSIIERNGEYIVHDTPLKYMFKIEQQLRGKKVLGLKTTYRDDKSGKTKVRTLEETLKFHGINTKKDSDVEQLQKLFKFKDIRNFGLAEPFQIHGVVQINTAVNAFADYTELCEGSYLDEAHFIHDFVVCPGNMMEYKDLGIEGVAEYTREDYEDFKDVITCCATNYHSKAKEGCNNEFALFIEMKDERGNMLRTLNRFVKVEKEDDVTVINLTKIAEQLEDIKEHIDNIEIQYDPYVTKINFPMDFENIRYRDIVSKEIV